MAWGVRTLLVAALVVVVSGCGDDGGEAGGDSGRTRAEYIALADAICAAGNAELEQAATDFFADKPNPTQAQEQQYAITVFVPNIEGQLADLRELDAPEGDEEEVTAVYDAAQSGLDELKADPSTYGGEPPAGFVEAGRLAADYGFEVCGDT